MKTIFNILFVCLLLIGPFSAQAQLLNRIKQAAEKGVSNAVEKKVESESEKIAMRQMEKALQNVYGEDFANSSGMDFGKIMSGISADVETADAYDFSGFSIMEMKSKDEKGKESDPVILKSFFSADASIMAMEFEADQKKKKSDGKMIMIYDLERNATIILMDNEGEKSSMAYGFDFAKMAEGINAEGINMEAIERDSDEIDYSFTKTGKTKTINGYFCEEYLVDNEDANMHYWITEKPITGSASIWGQNNPFVNAKMKNQQAHYQNVPSGNILEMLFESKKDKSSAEILVKEINDNAIISFSMAEYPNALKGMGKE